MTASSDEARLLFGKWKQDMPPLRIKLTSSFLIFDAVGTVSGFTPAALEIAGDAWRCAIPLEEAQFTFSDPREVPIPSIRETEAARYECGLSLRLPNGDQLVILEMKADDRGEDVA